MKKILFTLLIAFFFNANLSAQSCADGNTEEALNIRVAKTCKDHFEKNKVGLIKKHKVTYYRHILRDWSSVKNEFGAIMGREAFLTIVVKTDDGTCKEVVAWVKQDYQGSTGYGASYYPDLENGTLAKFVGGCECADKITDWLAKDQSDKK